MKTVIIQRKRNGVHAPIRIVAEDVSQANIDRLLEHVRAIEDGKAPRANAATMEQEKGHALAMSGMQRTPSQQPQGLSPNQHRSNRIRRQRQRKQLAAFVKRQKVDARRRRRAVANFLQPIPSQQQQARAGVIHKPISRCICGHTGDGKNSAHAGPIGHGPCTFCQCQKFTWKNFLADEKHELRLRREAAETQLKVFGWSSSNLDAFFDVHAGTLEDLVEALEREVKAHEKQRTPSQQQQAQPMIARILDAVDSDRKRRDYCMMMARRMREQGERLYCRCYIRSARIASVTAIQRLKYCRKESQS